MEDQSKPKSDIFNYTFKHEYKEVVNLLRDFKKCAELNNNILPDFSTDFNMTKYENTWQERSEFNILFKKQLRIYIRTVTYTETEDVTHIKWFLSVKEPIIINYFMSYSIYNDSLNGLCSLVHELTFPSDSKRLICDKDEPDKEKFLMYNYYDFYLTEKKNRPNIHVGSCEIKSDILSIWKLISNLKQFVEKVPLLCNDVYAEDEELTLGKLITLRWDSQYLKGEAILKVIEIKKEEAVHLITYQLVEANPPRPKQKIQWRLEQKENYCLLKLCHIYEEKVEKKTLQTMSYLKNEIFKQLKKCLEEYNAR